MTALKIKRGEWKIKRREIAQTEGDTRGYKKVGRNVDSKRTKVRLIKSYSSQNDLNYLPQT